MKIIKKIISCIFNPFTNLFRCGISKKSKFFDKHSFLVWLLSLIIVALGMALVYYFVYKAF